MRSVAFAIALAACTPELTDFDHPVEPASSVPALGSSQEDTGGGANGRPDAGAGGGGDAGAGGIGGIGDAGGFTPLLDAAPPDAAALLPDASTAPPFP